MKQLIIAEKPSVAQNISAALNVNGRKDGYIENDSYIISWCVGHLVGLAAADAYGEQYAKWNYDTLPILPKEWQYTIAADKGKQFKILKELMHRADVSEVVNACDAGREGENTEVGTHFLCLLRNFIPTSYTTPQFGNCQTP